MEFRHLRVFLVLAEELHFGRTAARLHVAQSAVSQTLRDLEDELDARLLERTSRQAKLTLAGQAFLSYAREAVQVVERGTKAARAAHSQSGRLQLRLLAAATVTGLPALLQRFQREHPTTVLEIRDGTSARNLEALEGAFCDIAFSSLASAKRLDPAYAHMTLESSGLGVAVPLRHRLAKLAVVRLEDLRGERMLSLQRDDEPDVRAILDAKLAGAGAIQTAIELAHPQALLSLIGAGLGVAILPLYIAQQRRDVVRAVPLAGPGQGGIIAVWNRRRLSEAAQRFVELLTASRAPAQP
jgi:DNA-binding transcriptional LysR family regulator